jgi:hypothetical protein
MYISPIERMKKVHIWIGKNSLSEEEYEKYFELDYSEGDFEDPDYQICQFCQDIGEVLYDEDFIGIIPIFDQVVSIREILQEVPIAENDIEKAISKCNELEMKTANAVFYLTDSQVEVPKPYKNSYNGLKYIGIFESCL